MKTQSDDPASRPDDENPEWTAADFANAKPALDHIAECFGAPAADALKRRPGRPAKLGRKINQTLRLDPEVVEAYRREGAGWQTLMNDVLRAHMPNKREHG
jgi:uncharacterized protein (DUF4415 family)